MNPNKRLRLANKKQLAGFIALHKAQYEESVTLSLDAAKLWRGLKEQERNYAKCLVNAANALEQLGRYSESINLLDEAIIRQKRILNAEYPDLVTSLNNLANVYGKQSEYEKAKELYKKILAILEKSANIESSNIAAYTFNNLGNIYLYQGDHEKAKEFYEKSLAIREKTLSSEHPDMAKILNNLGNIYLYQGDYKKAKEFYEKSLAIREKTLSSEHPDIAGSLNNLGNIYHIEGNFEKSQNYYQRAQSMIEKSLGSNHPTAQMILDNYFKSQQEIKDLIKKDIKQRIALEEAKKLSYLGYMATGIAHNINNPVGIIRLAAQNALYSLEQNTNNETGKEFFDDILVEANRLHEIIQKFRNFTNGDRKHRENVSLNEVVKTIQDYFENQLESHNIKLVFDLSDKNPQSYANDFVLQEVLTNLISNARDAVENISDATIWIKTWEQKNKVGFIVEDNGVGISEEQQPTLFIPFHSTKAHGTGLGLHFAYQSLIDLQGKISYQNRKPNGAHFLIELPTANGATYDK